MYRRIYTFMTLEPKLGGNNFVNLFLDSKLFIFPSSVGLIKLNLLNLNLIFPRLMWARF